MKKPSTKLALAFLDTVPDPVFVKDKRHVFLYVNDACCRFFGLSRKQIVGHSDRELLPAHEVDVFWEKDVEVFRTGLTNVNEETLTVTDGETRHIITKKSILQSDQGPVLVGIIQDVTERKRAETELRVLHDQLEERVAERTKEVAETREKLYQAERMSTLGALTGGMAHDFNNLLSIILLANEAVLGEENLSEAGRQYAMEAVAASRQGGELTRSLLAYARSQPLHPVSFDLAALLNETLRMLSRTLGTHTKVIVSCKEPQLSVLADPSMLQNALVNLAVNARDAMPDGGYLFICARRSNGVVEIEVRDQGMGIPPDIQQRIFDPFFTTKPTGSGTGLGLSSVHGFVHQSGGTIDVESEVGVGTTFRLYLPMGGTPTNVRRDVRVRNTGTLQLLIVEDQREILSSLMRLATRIDHRVAGAHNMGRAIQASQAMAQVDVLVTDVILGGGELGTDVVRSVRSTHPKCAVVYMSGHDRKHLAQLEPVTDGVFLQKPFTGPEFLAAIEEACARTN